MSKPVAGNSRRHDADLRLHLGGRKRVGEPGAQVRGAGCVWAVGYEE